MEIYTNCSQDGTLRHLASNPLLATFKDGLLFKGWSDLNNFWHVDGN